MISPEPFIQKCQRLAKAKAPYLEVLDGRIRLAWPENGTIGFMERADLIGLGITYDMLEEALAETGVTIDVSGRYPINGAIRMKLSKLFNAK